MHSFIAVAQLYIQFFAEHSKQSHVNIAAIVDKDIVINYFQKSICLLFPRLLKIVTDLILGAIVIFLPDCER